MNRFLALFILILGLGAPIAAAEMAPEERAAQNRAIALSVERQIMDCWSLPAGYEGKRVSVRLAFWGDGYLDEEPVVLNESLRVAGKYPVFMRSIIAALDRCLPFAGLAELGAEPHERFDITVHFQS
ncbi:MAG: hypothetical protein ABS75_30635 [Pelagibacterium sp. SCN 63-23]|nr:MAG: hypothetical protein ABS75_30635 [Pelagibacterium sp. SCN 63-23]